MASDGRGGGRRGGGWDGMSRDGAAVARRRDAAAAGERAALVERLARVGENGGQTRGMGAGVRAASARGGYWVAGSSTAMTTTRSPSGVFDFSDEDEDFSDAPYVLSSSAGRLWRLRCFSDDGAETPVRKVMSGEGEERALASLFEKVEISPGGPLEFSASPASTSRSPRVRVSSPSKWARDSAYIDDLLRRARAHRSSRSTSSSESAPAEWESQLADAASRSDDAECATPRAHERASPVDVTSLITPPLKMSTRSKTPAAPLRHQHQRRDSPTPTGVATTPREAAVEPRRDLTNPRELF